MLSTHTFRLSTSDLQLHLVTLSLRTHRRLGGSRRRGTPSREKRETRAAASARIYLHATQSAGVTTFAATLTESEQSHCMTRKSSGQSALNESRLTWSMTWSHAHDEAVVRGRGPKKSMTNISPLIGPNAADTRVGKRRRDTRCTLVSATNISYRFARASTGLFQLHCF